MHWVKLLVEGWILFGVITVMLGLLWTSLSTPEAQTGIVKNVPSVPSADFAAHLSKVRSA